MKKIVSLLLSVLMIVGIVMPVYAEDEPAVIASGTVKGSVTWKVTEDGVLTIGGTGPMENYTAALKISSLHYTKAPYYEYKDKMPYGHGEKSVYIVSGFMKLTRDEAFAIRYHMGFSGTEDNNTVGKALEMFPLAFGLCVADMEAAYFMEGTTDN